MALFPPPPRYAPGVEAARAGAVSAALRAEAAASVRHEFVQASHTARFLDTYARGAEELHHFSASLNRAEAELAIQRDRANAHAAAVAVNHAAATLSVSPRVVPGSYVMCGAVPAPPPLPAPPVA
eukprot:Hpha_TRINITY_DN2393_c0_g1::TRINITY_DN2393_c0_g1_i1::g.344::m.344